MHEIKSLYTKKGYKYKLVDVEDPYEDFNAEHRAAIANEIRNQIIPAIKRYVSENKKHTRGLPNPISDSFFSKSEVLKKWLEDIPTSRALFPLQKPELNMLADGTEMDELSKIYFPNVLDGIAIRRRARLMSDLMSSHFRDDAMTRSTEDALEWSSLASGSAIPVYDAIMDLSKLGISPNLKLYDISGKALKFAERIAKNYYSIEGIQTHKLNILKLGKLKKIIGLESQDAIDILGFFEYIPEKRWQYKPGLVFPGAIKFLKSSYKLLKPGGILILGNMNSKHPEIEFTLNVVRWPMIIPRSLSEIENILDKAKIPKDEITVYEISDGVYFVVEIKRKRIQ